MFNGNIKNTCSSRILCQVLPSRPFKSLPLAKFPGNIPRPERAGAGRAEPTAGPGRGVRRQLPCRLLSQVGLAPCSGHHCKTRRGAVDRGGSRGGGNAMLYLGAEPERRPPHRRGVSDRWGGRQPAGRGLLVMVTGQGVGRRPSSLPVSRRVARKDFRRRQVIVRHLSSRASAAGRGRAAVGVPLQHTQLRS